MGQVLLLLVVALTVVAVLFGVAVLVTGHDPGLDPAEPDGRAVPLPGDRPLAETDISGVRFDVALRGYRMTQVDRALRRAAYDIGYKDEMIGVLEAEIVALREGQVAEAEALRRARETSRAPVTQSGKPLSEGITLEHPAGAEAGTRRPVEAGSADSRTDDPAEEPTDQGKTDEADAAVRTERA